LLARLGDLLDEREINLVSCSVILSAASSGKHTGLPRVQ